MKTEADATKASKEKKATKEEQPQMKKSKFVLAWEKMKPYNGEYADMRAILK